MWPTLFKIPWFYLPIRGYGLMLMIGFLGGTWWAARRADKVKCDPDLVINFGFLAACCGVIYFPNPRVLSIRWLQPALSTEGGFRFRASGHSTAGAPAPGQIMPVTGAGQ